MQRIHGVVQHYGWGDPEYIPNLLGQEPDGRPWAELWFGTHPNGPSHLEDGRRLDELTGPLPYLTKLLAAGSPLSLQTHPDEHRARHGFEAGRYPDPFAKPELIHALTGFEAFCGVRPVDATLDLLEQLNARPLAELLRSEGVLGAFDALLRGRFDTTATISACRVDSRAEADWVRRLDQLYPHDPSVAATLLLNYVRLQPGEALALAAGNLHAYLHGAGIEVMGNSDNVVRCGLTTKPVDVDELLEVMDPTPLIDPVLGVDQTHEVPGLGMRVLRIDAGDEHHSQGHEIAVDAAGNGWYLEPDSVAGWSCLAHVVTRTT